MDKIRWTSLVLLAAMALYCGLSYQADVARLSSTDIQERTEAEGQGPSRTAFALTLAYLVATAALIVFVSVDAFAAGSLVVVATIQTFAFVGWLGATDRAYLTFYELLIFDAILAGIVVATHIIQRDRKASAKAG
jgi:hypothetical protein